jgi:hypothetical protein
MHFFSLSFSFGLAHFLLFLLFLVIPPATPSPAGLFLFIPPHVAQLRRSPSLDRAGPTLSPSLPRCQAGPARQGHPQPRARPRACTSRPPQPPYKAATPRPRSRQQRSPRLASQTLAAQARHRRTSAARCATAPLLPAIEEVPIELRVAVRSIAGPFSSFSPPSRTRNSTPKLHGRALPPCAPLQPPSHQPKPLDAFLIASAFFPCSLRMKPSLDGRLRPSPASPLPPATVCRCRRRQRCRPCRPSPAQPSDPDPTGNPSQNPHTGQIIGSFAL